MGTAHGSSWLNSIDEKVFELIEGHAPSQLNKMKGSTVNKKGKEKKDEVEGEKEEEKREEQEDEEEEGVDWQKRFLKQQELNSEFKKNMTTLSNTVVRMELEMKMLKLAK